MILEIVIKFKKKIIAKNKMENIKILLKYMDKINTIYKPFSPCKKKCPKCCYYDVMVSELEISLIENYLYKKKCSTIVKKCENVSNVYDKEKKKKFGYMSNEEKCPFLRNNECFIYNVRPFFCRTYISLEKDNKKCGDINSYSKLFNKNLIEEEYYKIITKQEYIRYITNPKNCLFEIHDCFYEVK
jgi:hypothetical protein